MNKIASLAALTLLGISSVASAAEIWNHTFPVSGQLKWTGFDSGSTAVNVQKSNGTSLSYSGSGGQFGGYFYTDGTQGNDEFFRFFCIDLSQSAATGPLDYRASVLDSAVLARLFDIAYPNSAIGDFYDGATKTGFGAFTSGILSSAFQLAVWELFYDSSSSYSLGGGNFKSSIGANASGTPEQKAVAQANTWLAQLKDGAGTAAGWTLYRFTSDTHQDYLAAIHTQPPLRIIENAAPEPGTLAMLGLGIAALGAVRSRRR